MNDAPNLTEPCPRSDTRHEGAHVPAQMPHVCPFKQEINNDSKTLCRCCPECTRECAYDI